MSLASFKIKHTMKRRNYIISLDSQREAMNGLHDHVK